ncbi:MAG TPA: metallophosphoesterase [Candidatus Methylacidiphilales bacterium]|nr:metallophosphoesterase [Candidatus Methylacidiphilales bacterium]
MATHRAHHIKYLAGNKRNPTSLAPDDNSEPDLTGGPRFAQPAPTPDPAKFTVRHGSDKQAYAILDSQQGTLLPREIPQGPSPEPRMSLADAIGEQGPAVLKAIKNAGQIVFHALGDTGNTRGSQDEDLMTDKLGSDFQNEDPRAVPSFCYNLGDVVYSFGEAQYYYDQFYDPYRDYPAPIFAIAGNHDGMVAPNSSTPTLQAFLDNFCAYNQPFHRTPEAGNLVRTAGRQPGVYFTLEAPFVRILGLYSNCLEDPGVISSQSNSAQKYPCLTDVQLDFLTAALKRVKTEKFPGALLIAVHHPPYVAVTPKDRTVGRHSGSPLMLADIDETCAETGVWPHAILSGHAHNYQRFTRLYQGRETPFVICGNGGHAHTRLTKKGTAALRTPMTEPLLSNGTDEVVFENYDDTDFGYLRVIVDKKQLRIEYHPAADGDAAKTPDDSVTVDLASRKLIHYQAASG